MPEGVIVFAGPSLPRSPDAGWQDLLAACDLRPPARRGDVLAALAARPAALVLVDGYYYSVPAVTHKELLYALDAGVRVFGAASLGALRAAELAPFGMIGVGEVFEAYRSGALDGDDEVAILHTPAELGYRGLTVALVELRHALAALHCDWSAAVALVARVKELAFSARHPDVIEDLARRELGEETARALMGRLAAASVKQDDTRRAIAAALVPGEAPTLQRRDGGGFLGFYKEIYLPIYGAWRAAQVLHPGAAGFVRDCRVRSLLASAALRAGIEPPAPRVRRLAAALERCHRRAAGSLLFPEPEYAEEARVVALARAACRHLGGRWGALQDLGRRFGIARGPESDGVEEDLLALTAHPDLTPGWWLARAFSFTPALLPAQEVAGRAADLHACLERWAGGSRVARIDLRRIAAGLWRCAPDDVEEEGRRRALYENRLTGGLWGALEWLAAAESLPRPLNDYPQARAALGARPLAPPVGL